MTRIEHQKNRWKGSGLNPDKCRKLLQNKYNCSKESLVIDHIIPYCISGESKLDNLQLLNKPDHLKKTIKDKKIIKKLKEEMYIKQCELYPNFVMILLKSKDEVKKRYLELKFLIDKQQMKQEICEKCGAKIFGWRVKYCPNCGEESTQKTISQSIEKFK